MFCFHIKCFNRFWMFFLNFVFIFFLFHLYSVLLFISRWSFGVHSFYARISLFFSRSALFHLMYVECRTTKTIIHYKTLWNEFFFCYSCCDSFRIKLFAFFFLLFVCFLFQFFHCVDHENDDDRDVFLLVLLLMNLIFF